MPVCLKIRVSEEKCDKEDKAVNLRVVGTDLYRKCEEASVSTKLLNYINIVLLRATKWRQCEVLIEKLNINFAEHCLHLGLHCVLSVN